MIYVTPLFTWQSKNADSPMNGKQVAFLYADDKESLHLFADTMGLKREWARERNPVFVHYRINPDQQQYAISIGAVEKCHRKHAGDLARDRMCRLKDRHATLGDAQRAAKAYLGRQEHLRPYHCPHCNGWHLAKSLRWEEDAAYGENRGRKGKGSR